MRLNYAKLGAGLLASGTLLIQFGSVKAVWWIGVVFTVAGPLLMGVRQPRS